MSPLNFEELSKNKKIIGAFILFLAAGPFVVKYGGDVLVSKNGPVYCSVLPTTVHIGTPDEKTIRGYYERFFNGLSEKERAGEPLLKILGKMNRNYFVNFFNYDDIGFLYSITDRDWKKSHIGTLVSGNLSQDNQTIKNFDFRKEGREGNPVLRYLYVNYEKEKKDTRFLAAKHENKRVGFDKEHMWPQSHGFKARKPENPQIAMGPAGTDLHNLIAAESTVNRNYHNNYYLGKVIHEIDMGPKIGQINDPYSIEGNKVGIIDINKGPGDKDNKIFEPDDFSKTTMARGILYMAMAYGNVENREVTNFDPYLTLVNYVGSTNSRHSTETQPAEYGVLAPILEWNSLRKPTEQEKRRNDLIFYLQGNRNPFIDFPFLSQLIWDEKGNFRTEENFIGFANPSIDKLYSLKVPKYVKKKAKDQGNKVQDKVKNKRKGKAKSKSKEKIKKNEFASSQFIPLFRELNVPYANFENVSRISTKYKTKDDLLIETF